jgi:tRNA threonylcarbamoyladenosine biosynthesis protein TsaE
MGRPEMIFGIEELDRFCRGISDGLAPGSVVALIGDLGAGKTTFAKGLAAGLGVTDPVTSPTFTLINEYGGGRLPMYHFDLYRLGESNADVYQALEDLGWEEYIYGDGVCVIEWADMIEDNLPPNAMIVRLSHIHSSPDQRKVTLPDCYN